MSRFRKTYRELSEPEKERVEQIKDAAERLEALIDAIPVPCSGDLIRARELALANLEQAVMWATKAAT